MILMILPLLLLSTTTVTSNVIHWVSEPVLPGEAAMIAVASLNRSLPLQIFGRPSGASSLPFLPLLTQGETKHGITATIPPTYAVGEFELQARRGSATSPSYRVNVPRPWFVFGDQGNTATPGGHVRVVGDGISLPSRLSFPSYDRTMEKLRQYYHGIAIDVHSLAPPPIPQLFLTGAVTKHTIQLAGTNLTRSHATFALPHDVPMDEYTVEIANSMTGTRAPLCTFLTPSTPCLSTINITAPIALPASTKKFIVQAQQPGYGRNATAAIQQALSEAQEYGKGGIVYLPRGQYFMQGPILIPEGCTLQGERRDLVSLYFFEQNQTTAPDAYITGRTNTTQSFGVEDLTIYVTSYANNIIRFQPSTNGGHVKRIRMRYNSYFALEPVTGQASRGRNTSWSHGQGTAVMLAGKNIQIVDNDIYSSGDVVSTRYNGMAGGSYFHIARNRFWNGGTTHWGIEWKQCIYESNEATGTSITAMGSNYPQYNHNDGNPHVQNIYHFNNSQNMVWGNDREMMTSDAGGGVYFGGVAAYTETTPNTYSIDLSQQAYGTQPGGAMCVLQGTGTGECRRVVVSGKNTSNYTKGWRTNRPFSLPLDQTSMVAIMPFQGRIAFNRNSYKDGGSVQFYSTAIGCQAMENVFERTGGLIAWGRAGAWQPHYMWGPNFMNVFYDNVVLEGNHIYNYDTHYSKEQQNISVEYYPGGSKTIEPWTFGSLTNDQGPPFEPSASNDCVGSQCFKGALNRFTVLRGNIVKSNGGVLIRGTSSNCLAEANEVELSDVGVYVNETTTMGGIVLVRNVEPNNVPSNYNPYVLKP